MRFRICFLLLGILAARLAVLPAQGDQTGGLLAIMAGELERNFAILREKADPPVYFMAYAITENEVASVSASYGALTGQSANCSRTLDVTVRVGSRALDNYRAVRGERVSFTPGSPVALDNEPRAIRLRLWLDTDQVYRQAAERLIKIKTNTQVRVAAEDTSADFSEESPATHRADPPPLDFPAEQWAARLRKISAVLGRHPEILTSSASASAQREVKYLVTSEGARLQHGRGFARVVLNASTRAEDGMNLFAGETFEAVDSSGLPDDRALASAAAKVAKQLVALLHAPVAEPFVGPAILSGRASGVFFHEIFGHRIEGHRQKDETEGQTFTKSVGGPVLPPFLSVLFDPTRRKEGGIDLNGWYAFDDEGVPAQPIRVVDNGILKAFLMSRTPIAGFPKSNGHGRRQPGREIVSRQSNLIVESARQVSDKELRKMLIDEIKRQNKPYGLFFEQVTGGFTTTARAALQAFKVIPIVVYRVYPDGRPDELIRGVDIVGTPLASFAKILATSSRTEVFNGYCGAESGSVPVSAVAPAMLVSEIEIEKKAKSQDRPPLLPAPSGKEERP